MAALDVAVAEELSRGCAGKTSLAAVNIGSGQAGSQGDWNAGSVVAFFVRNAAPKASCRDGLTMSEAIERKTNRGACRRRAVRMCQDRNPQRIS